MIDGLTYVYTINLKKIDSLYMYTETDTRQFTWEKKIIHHGLCLVIYYLRRVWNKHLDLIPYADPYFYPGFGVRIIVFSRR